jgi:hypothetical protein
MGPNSLGTVGSKGCKGQMPRIRGTDLVGGCARPACGTKTVGIPEYNLAVANPIEPEPKPPKPPTPGPVALPSKAVAVYPLNGATGIFTNGLTLTWLDGGGATNYSVWINGILKGRKIGTSYSFTGAALLTDYTWRVDSLNDGGVTTGDTWVFQTANRAAPTPPAKPTNPSPANGATGLSSFVAPTLSWANGGGALSYDVYLDGIFLGNQTGLSRSVGLLTALSSHTWRVDAVNVDGTTAGTTWSFTMGMGLPPAPTKAVIGSPANGSTSVVPGVVALSWTDGGGAVSYNVYVDGVLQGNQVGTSFNTASLGSLSAHTWRIDSVNTGGTTTGDTWSFTTILHATTVTWAAQVVTNGGAAVSTATKQAVSDFCYGLDAASLTANIKALNCFVPDNLIAAETPLIQGVGNALWTNHNFVAGDLSINGLKGNGSNKYLETGVNPNTAFADNTNVGTTFYLSELVNNGGIDMGASQGATTLIETAGGATGTVWDTYNNTAGQGRCSSSVGWAIGYLGCNRLANNDSKMYFASGLIPHTTVGTAATSGGSRPNVQIFWFCQNNNGTPTAYVASRYSFAAIHLAYTAAQSLTFYTLIEALRRALGGGFARSEEALDTLESYANTDPVNGLNGGTGSWGAAYVAS